MELLKFWYLFLRKKYLISACLIISALIAALYLAFATNIYEADATLLVTDSKSQSYLGDISAMADMMNIGKADPINTQMELIKRRPILTRVINSLSVKKSKYYPRAIRDLMAGVNVQSIRNTNLIVITYRNPSANVAAVVVNALADAFVLQNQEFNQEELSSARIFIEKQLEMQKSKVQEAGNAVIAYKKQSQTVSLAQETSVQLESISKMEANKMEMESQIKGALAQKRSLEAKINNPNNQSDPFYSLWMKSLEDVNNQITNLRAQRENIETEIAKSSNSFNKLPPKEIELARLTRDENLSNEIYIRLLNKYDEVRINEAGKIANIKIVEPSVTPESPISPKKKKIMLLAILLGLMGGFGLALIIEYLHDKPRSIEEVKAILPYPILGQIPYVKNLQTFFSTSAPRSAIAESLRIVYSNMRFIPIASKKNLTIMLTSLQPNEGKSTLAINLAIVYTRMGKKALLLDVDLRKSGMKNMFHTQDNKGLTDYLIGDKQAEEIIHIDPETGLHVICAGTPPPNPAELLAGEKMITLMEKLKQQYELILIDTPPITLVSETLSLTKTVDGLLITVDMKNTSMRNIKNMQDLLLMDKALPVLGIIYNKLSRETGGLPYGDYNYND